MYFDIILFGKVIKNLLIGKIFIGNLLKFFKFRIFELVILYILI